MFNNVTILNASADFTCEDYSRSPFEVYANESITFEQKPMIPIMPTDIDREILEIVGKTTFCTSALILCQLEKKNVPFEASNVKNRIHRMCEAEFLMGYRFRTAEGGRSSHQALRLGWRGVGFLRAHGTQPRLGAYLASISEDPTQTKKILSAAQLVIRTGVALEDVSFCQAIFVPSKNPAKKSTRLFRPQAVVHDGDQTAFIESVRQNEGWVEYLLDKIYRIESVCRTAKDANIEIKNPTLVLVAENCTHMNMLLRMIERRGCSIPVYFTADSLVYSSPDRCLFALRKKKSFWDMFLAG